LAKSKLILRTPSSGSAHQEKSGAKNKTNKKWGSSAESRIESVRKLGVAGAGAAGAGWSALNIALLWMRRHPFACPYSQRFWLDISRPFITRRHLNQIIAPAAGERILEVGAGTGYYALKAVEWVKPGGTIYAIDIQRKMMITPLTVLTSSALAISSCTWRTL
jgi:protein-L-isoaspartate(D-aspartate) O-methyltransferase (PCMT)